ncbi:glycoside hydrolase family 5 protein, partial [Marasmius fiardii PR-910]
QSDLYRYRRQQSINLGSWFVAEEWMTPSLFNSARGPKTAEIDVASGSNAQTILENHWDTFITQSDFYYLASIGINTVRLPIGYWSLGPVFCQDTPFQKVSQVYGGSWDRVLNSIKMAENAGLGILVDLHGAVGSQNGQAHSGISDGHVGLFENRANIDKTIRVLVHLTETLVSIPNVVGIQLLNEPNDDPLLCDFYSEAIIKMRAVSQEAKDFPLYVHNAFNLPKFTSWVANRTDFVVQDHHSYFVFTPYDAAKPASQHTSDVNSRVSKELGSSSVRHNLVVDEWSCALTPQSLEREDNKHQAIRDFCESQMDVYTKETAGWGFWSLKKEDCDPAWCFYAALKEGMLQPPFFAY